MLSANYADSIFFKTQAQILSDLLTKFTLEELQNPTPEMEKDIEAMITKSAIASSANKKLWFSINENHGEYIIAMYFENKITR